MYNQILFLLECIPLNSYGSTLLPELKHQIFIKYILLNINNKIEKRLGNVFGDKLLLFKQLMEETKCFISGSFIIQCILNEEWKGSDVDIYVPTIGNQIRVDHSPFSKVDDFMYKNMNMKDGYIDSYPEVLHSGLKWVRNYVDYIYDSNGKQTYEKRVRIQIIGIEISKNISQAVQFVEETFDFDICKNVYSFEGIYVKNIKEILSKTTSFKSSKLHDSSVNRCKKYEERGFSFLNQPTDEKSDE